MREVRQVALPESFSTDRLRAERLTSRHLPDLLAFHAVPAVMAGLGGVRTEDETAEYLARNLQHWSDHGFGVWILRCGELKEVVGRAVLRHLTLSGVDEVEIGYALYPQYWGQGLATEIAEACLELARQELLLDSLVGVTTRDNIASKRVLLKIGFLHEAEMMMKETPCSLFRIRFARSI